MPSRERRLIRQLRAASPQEILRLWRFEPVGSEYFEGDLGTCLAARYAEIRSMLSDSEWTALSKSVGWNPQPLK